MEQIKKEVIEQEKNQPKLKIKNKEQFNNYFLDMLLTIFEAKICEDKIMCFENKNSYEIIIEEYIN